MGKSVAENSLGGKLIDRYFDIEGVGSQILSEHISGAMADMWGANFLNVNTYGFANIWREARTLDQRQIRDAPRIKYEVRVVKTWEPDALGVAKLGNHSIARPVIALNWNFMKGYRLFKGSWVKDRPFRLIFNELE